MVTEGKLSEQGKRTETKQNTSLKARAQINKTKQKKKENSVYKVKCSTASLKHAASNKIVFVSTRHISYNLLVSLFAFELLFSF